MGPRLPVERRVNEETAVEEARCRRTCRMIGKVRARERRRGRTISLSVREVDKLFQKFGGKCCISNSAEDLTIARINASNIITYENAVIVSKFLENALFKGNAYVRHQLAEAIHSATLNNKTVPHPI